MNFERIVWYSNRISVVLLNEKCGSKTVETRYENFKEFNNRKDNTHLLMSSYTLPHLYFVSLDHVCLPVFLSLYISVCVFLHVGLSVCLFSCLSVSLSVCLAAVVSWSGGATTRVDVICASFLSACISVCLFVSFISVCLCLYSISDLFCSVCLSSCSVCHILSVGSSVCLPPNLFCL